MRLSLQFCITLCICISFSAIAQERKPIEFEHIFDGTFTPESVQNIRWMNNGKFYTTTNGHHIIRINITNGDSLVIFDGSKFNDLNIQGYEFSADENLILIRTDVEPLWRRSTKENYFVFNRSKNTMSKLTKSNEKQQYAQLNADGDKAAFVQNNNLFWVDLDTGEEIQITNDGAFNSIINGAADWVYEEEFSFAKAWFWSPNGDKIAFYRFDEAHVKEFNMEQWGTIYPEQVRFKYPKAGEENAIVSIHVYDLNTGETSTMDVGEKKDQYIPRINWSRDNEILAIRRMNRLQNKEDLLFADVLTGTTTLISTETSNTWIDIHDNLYFLENGKQFMTTSSKNGFNHIYLYNLKGELVNQITNGEYDVTDIVGYNERNNNIYYLSTEVSPLERHLYRIREDGKHKSSMTDKEGWYSINMSRDFKYYIQTHSNFDTPPVYTLHKENSELVRVIENNVNLLKNLDTFNYQEKEFITLDINGAALNAYMIKPPNFDSSKTYPVLMYVYGGPGSQTVTRRFEFGQRPMWHQYLVNQGYIVLSVDNRGTGGRGAAFKNQTYKQLGVLETKDQISVAQTISSFPYIDKNRIGIWGWSYGGYLSTLAIAEGNKIFTSAIAIAPVTHWKLYDTIYTERFMQTPLLNSEGYNASAPINVAHKIIGNYLLVHGTGDDNVHYQNAVALVQALIENDVQFETMYYPNLAHSISGGNARRHLWRLMSDFIKEKL